MRMRLKVSKSKNAASLYVIKSTYVNGKHSTKIVEKLGTYAELQERLNGGDPIEWAKQHIAELTEREKEEKQDILVKYSPTKTIKKGEQHSFNAGYLFLQKIYHELGLHTICREMTKKHKATSKNLSQHSVNPAFMWVFSPSNGWKRGFLEVTTSLPLT